MKRRTFVQSAALGALGIGLKPDFSPLSLFAAQGVHHWLRQLTGSCGARWRSTANQSSASFQELTTSLNGYFAKRGYSANNFGYYFYGSAGNACFYALKMRHANTGIQDLLVPVLALQPDGAWRHIFTLSGFQLEALAHAAEALKDQELPLQQLLLPDPTGTPSYTGFNSQKAHIAFKTLVKSNTTQTSITISSQKTIIYQHEFTSKHCLTGSAVHV